MTQNKTQATRISLDEVRRRLQEFVFVDARSATALARNPMQIAKAIHLPFKELDQAAKRLPRNRTLITYCT